MADVGPLSSFEPSAPPFELLMKDVKDEKCIGFPSSLLPSQSTLDSTITPTLTPTFDVIRAWRLRDQKSDCFRCCISTGEFGHFLFILAPNSLHRINLETGICRMIVPDILRLLSDASQYSITDCNPFTFKFTHAPEIKPQLTAISTWQSSIFVSDAANCRILVFTFDGSLQPEREIKTVKLNWPDDPKPTREPPFGLAVITNHDNSLFDKNGNVPLQNTHSHNKPRLITTIRPLQIVNSKKIKNPHYGVHMGQYVPNEKSIFSRLTHCGGEDASSLFKKSFIAGDIIYVDVKYHNESPLNNKFEESRIYYPPVQRLIDFGEISPFIWRFDTFIFINKAVVGGNNEIYIREQRHSCTHAFRQECFPLRTASAEGLCHHEGQTYICARDENCIQVYDEKMNHMLNFDGRSTWTPKSDLDHQPGRPSSLCQPTGVAASPRTKSVFVVSKGGFVWEFAQNNKKQ